MTKRTRTTRRRLLWVCKVRMSALPSARPALASGAPPATFHTLRRRLAAAVVVVVGHDCAI